MDLYSIQWKNSAKKELKKFEKSMIKQIIKEVELIATNPRSTGSIKLQEQNIYIV